MLTLRGRVPGAAAFRVRWGRLGRPAAAVTVAMAGAAGLALLWSARPGAPALVMALVGAPLVGWAAVNLLAPALEGDAAARQEAEQLRAFRHEIVTTVSHELRTPLTVIQGLTSVLNSRWDVLPETRKLDLIDSIHLNVASLDASILHFVDAGRLVRGEYRLAPQVVSLREIVDPVMAKLGGVLAGHEVQIDVPDEGIWADPEALGRILELLLANAARFAPLATLVAVRATRGADAGVALSVSDRGPGIAAQHLPHVFEPFWRADVTDSGVSRGAGLGLFIVKELTERHGGTVKISTAKGRGTTVVVSLPGPPPEVAVGLPAGAAASPNLQPTGAASGGRAPRPARPGRVRIRPARRSAVDHLFNGE
jgi:signal transduction histidine kinase